MYVCGFLLGSLNVVRWLVIFSTLFSFAVAAAAAASLSHQCIELRVEYVL